MEELPRDLQRRKRTAERDDVGIAAARNFEAEQREQEAAYRQRELHSRKSDGRREDGHV